MLQLHRETIRSYFSTTDYSQIVIYTAEWTVQSNMDQDGSNQGALLSIDSRILHAGSYFAKDQNFVY